MRKQSNEWASRALKFAQNFHAWTNPHRDGESVWRFSSSSSAIMLEMKLFIFLIMRFTELVKWGKFEGKLLLFKCKQFLLHNWKFVVVMTKWERRIFVHSTRICSSNELCNAINAKHKNYMWKLSLPPSTSTGSSHDKVFIGTPEKLSKM